MSRRPALSILLYPCTIVGYVRGVLLVGALALHFGGGNAWDEHWVRIACAGAVGLSLLLDGLDGYLARVFGHTSHFGALFDLMLDLVTHTVVWVASGIRLAVAFVMLEWAAGVCIVALSRRQSISWKTTLTEQSPHLIRYYFSRNQRNLLSAYSNIGHFVIPIAFYLKIADTWMPLTFLPGLAVYEAVTAYMLYTFVRILAYYETL